MENSDPIKVLYHDRSIVVCVKPAGVLSEEGGMPELLCNQLSVKRVYCVHRLDKNVSGAMVYALDGKTAAELSEAFSAGKVSKEYLAIVQGAPEQESGTLTDLLFHDRSRNKTYVVQRKRKGVREAILDYKLLNFCSHEGAKLSLLKVKLHTGRSHQIRIQLASRKMPIAGDASYGSGIKLKNIALISYKLEFEHPQTGESMKFSILPPGEAPWNLFPDELPEIE